MKDDERTSHRERTDGAADGAAEAEEPKRAKNAGDAGSEEQAETGDPLRRRARQLPNGADDTTIQDILVDALAEFYVGRRSEIDFGFVVADLIVATGRNPETVETMIKRLDVKARAKNFKGSQRTKSGPAAEDDPLSHWIAHGDLPTEAPPMAVEGLLPRDGIALISGVPAIGKTSVGGDLMVAQAANIKFAGREMLRSGGSAWFATEGRREFMPRLDALAKARLEPLGVYCGINPSRLPILFATDVPALSNKDNFDVYRRRIEAAQRRLRDEYKSELVTIYFDTFVSSARIEKAGDTGKNEEVMARVRALAREFDVLTMLFDHIGKDEERGTRDSSVKEAEVDAVIYLKGRKENGSFANRRLILDKLRSGPSGLTIPFEIVGAPYDDSDKTIGIPRWEVHPEADADGGRPAPKARSKGINDGEMLALQALGKVSARLPADDERCGAWIAMSAWRLMYNGMSTVEKRNTRNKAWNRDSQSVITKGYVESEDEKVRLTYSGRMFVD